MKQAQSIMAVNIVVALLMVVFSYLWGSTIAAVVVDAALTPAEMKDPALVTAVS